MTHWACNLCKSQLWHLAHNTVVCAKCGHVPASIRLVFIPVEASAQTVERQPSKEAGL